MSAVVKAATSAVSSVVKTVGNVVSTVVDTAAKAVKTVGKAAEKVVQAAVKDPIKTIATVAAIAAAPATGGTSLELIPVINGVDVLAKGGSLEDAAKAAAISYVAQGAGNLASSYAAEATTAATYGTNVGSAQTATLAAQDAATGSLSPLVGAAKAVAAGVTAGTLSGGDITKAAENALIGYASNTALSNTYNLASETISPTGYSQAPIDTAIPVPVSQIGEPVTSLAQADMGTVSDVTPGLETLAPASATVTPGIVQNTDGTITQTFDDNSSITTTPTGDVVSLTTSDGQTVDLQPAAATETTAASETTAAPSAAEPVPQTSNVVTNPDGTITQIYDDGSTQTFTPDGQVLSATTTEGDTVSPSAELQPSTPVEQPANQDLLANPTIVKNPDGSYTQTFDDGSTQTFDENMNVISATTTDGEIIYPSAELQPSTEPGAASTTDITPTANLNLSGVGNYFQNQFINALISNTLGGKFQPGTKTYMPRGSASGQTPSVVDLALSQYGLSSGDDTPLGTTQNVFYPSTTQDGLFNVANSMEWAPMSKIGGLGFAGKYINREPDTYYVNKDADIREKLKRDAFLSEGWQTDLPPEENPYYNYILDTQTQDIQTAAEGGLIDHNPEFYSEGGASLAQRYVKGDGDGTSDSVPAMLASGEFVIPADVVSGLGNGDNDAGAQVLDRFMQEIRKHKRSAKSNELPPDSEGPLSYMSKAMKKVK